MPSPTSHFRHARTKTATLAPTAVVLLALLSAPLAGCSSQPPARAPASTAAATSVSPPLTVAEGNLRLISASITAAKAGQPVYLNATIDNVNPTPVQLTAITLTTANVAPTRFSPVTIPGYAHTTLTGNTRLQVATATRRLAAGAAVTTTLRFTDQPEITVALPVR